MIFYSNITPLQEFKKFGERRWARSPISRISTSTRIYTQVKLYFLCGFSNK